MNVEILHCYEEDNGKIKTNKYWVSIEVPTGFYRTWGRCGRAVPDQFKKDRDRKEHMRKRAEKLRNGYVILSPNDYDATCPGLMDQLEGELLMFVMNNEIQD